MSDLSAIIEKIKKLNAKATNDAVTEEEAAMFMEKVQKLLSQHNLDASILGVASGEVLPVDLEKVFTPYSKIKWRQVLHFQVCKTYYCKGLWYQDAFGYVGKEHNREIAKSMFSYIERAIVRLSRTYSSKQSARYHFEKGAGFRMAQRLRIEFDKINNVRPEWTPAGNPQNLPALTSMEVALIDTFMKDISLTKARKQQQIMFNAAAQAGHLAANGISLNVQVNSSKANAFLLGK